MSNVRGYSSFLTNTNAAHIEHTAETELGGIDLDRHSCGSVSTFDEYKAQSVVLVVDL